MDDILHNLAVIKERIRQACSLSGRSEDSVKLLLATKTVSPDRIKIALNAGETLIGENKVQELKEKFEDLKLIPHKSHFIGHLQTGKIKEVICYADCIQSVDRIELAEKLQRRLEYENKSIDIFIQVNTSYEDSKFGVDPDLALQLARDIKPYDRLNITGLMTIGLFSTEADRVRKCFQRLQNVQSQLLDHGFQTHEMSMGMSGDLEIAIQEGATIIRIGTAIFGHRIYPDSYYWNESK